VGNALAESVNVAYTVVELGEEERGAADRLGGGSAHEEPPPEEGGGGEVTRPVSGSTKRKVGTLKVSLWRITRGAAVLTVGRRRRRVRRRKKLINPFISFKQRRRSRARAPARVRACEGLVLREFWPMI
jgi:hypothetical protein